MASSVVEESKVSDTKAEQPNLTEGQNDKVFKATGLYLYEDKKLKRVSISLSMKTLTLEADDQIVKSIHLEDLLGAQSAKVDLAAKKIVPEESDQLSPQTNLLKIHLMIKPKKEFGVLKDPATKPEPRKIEKLMLYCDDSEIVSKWRNLILHAGNNPEFRNFIKDHNVNDLPPFKRTLVVFIMVSSGKGKAEAFWTKCKKLLTRAGLDFHEVLVDHYSKVSGFFENNTAEELKKFGAIVSISGDGVPHDLINRFYRRPDCDELIKIPIMLIPGGSCNALTQNILDRSGEDASLESCCYVLSKGRSFQSDLTVYERDDNVKIYSFLSLTWAAPANIDLDSETLRSMGNIRFDIYGAWEVLTLKKYKAKFSYSGTVERPPPLSEQLSGDDWKTCDEDFSYLSIHNMPWIGMNYEALPFSDLEDGVNYFIAIKGEKISRKALLNTRKFLKPNPHVKSEDDLKDLGLSVGKIKSFRLEPYGDRLGKYSIDGEEYEVKPLQGWVIKKGITLVGVPEEAQLNYAD